MTNDDMEAISKRIGFQRKLRAITDEMASAGIPDIEIFDTMARTIFSFYGGEGPERRDQITEWFAGMSQYWFVDALEEDHDDDDDPPARPPHLRLIK